MLHCLTFANKKKKKKKTKNFKKYSHLHVYHRDKHKKNLAPTSERKKEKKKAL